MSPGPEAWGKGCRRNRGAWRPGTFSSSDGGRETQNPTAPGSVSGGRQEETMFTRTVSFASQSHLGPGWFSAGKQDDKIGALEMSVTLRYKGKSRDGKKIKLIPHGSLLGHRQFYSVDTYRDRVAEKEGRWPEAPCSRGTVHFCHFHSPEAVGDCAGRTDTGADVTPVSGNHAQ